MHQTAREFFFRQNTRRRSEFTFSEDIAHTRIATTCIRYLMLCAANIDSCNIPQLIESWAPNHFEEYVAYLNERPFINYALEYLHQHMNSNNQVIQSRLISQLVTQLTDRSGAFLGYLLRAWTKSSLGVTLPFHNRKKNCR
jgi:hypothetical protein